jgi:hypothetical protein
MANGKGLAKNGEPFAVVCRFEVFPLIRPYWGTFSTAEKGEMLPLSPRERVAAGRVREPPISPPPGFW